MRDYLELPSMGESPIYVRCESVELIMPGIHAETSQPLTCLQVAGNTVFVSLPIAETLERIRAHMQVH